MQTEELVTISIGMGSSESELFKAVRDKSIVAHITRTLPKILQEEIIKWTDILMKTKNER